MLKEKIKVLTAKQKMLVVSMIVTIIVLISGGTLAYFTVEDSVENVITTGNVDLVIHQKTSAGDEYKNDDTEIMPGDKLDMIVTAENIGNHPIYLRMKLQSKVNDEMLTADDCILFNFNLTEWTYKDEYYYYNKVLEAGETTAPLFSGIDIEGAEMGNEYLGKEFELNIVAYGVQSENNGLNVWEAFGWPED